MPFLRTKVSYNGRLEQPLSSGDGFVGNPAPYSKSSDADQILTPDIVGGGFVIQVGTLTAKRALTFPAAVDLLASFPSMNVGDTFPFVLSNGNTANFNVWIANGTGMTKAGLAEVAYHSSRTFLIEKTSETTVVLY